MKRIVFPLLMVVFSCGGSGETSADLKAVDKAQTLRIKGAGSSFAFPILSAWAHDYAQKTGTELNYQSIGSGGGIAQIKAKTVDFGASDAPLTQEELKEAGLLQFPFIMGGVVPVVNVEGVTAGALKLDAPTLAAIFLKKITTWNDPAIAALNEGQTLPSQAIAVVHRSDGSGTTWIFTNYLSKVSPQWEAGPGNGKTVAWPTGMGGKGNEGVATYVQRTPGSIGYVEYAYALQNKLAYTQLQNKEGAFVSPSAASFQAAASGADWKNAPGFRVVLTDQAGGDSWPITGAVYAMVHTEQVDAAQAKAVLAFFDWAYSNGSTAADRLDYVSMPDDVADLVRGSWSNNISSGDAPIWEN